MITKVQLQNMTVKELLELPEAKQVIGRHKMRKDDLVEAIVEIILKSQEAGAPIAEVKSKKDYVENVKIGAILAFKVNDSKLLSGKVQGIMEKELIVETKNGIRFNVKKPNVVWVKTGARWPKGVYEALKGGAYVQN